MGDKKRKRLDGKGQRPRKKAAPLSAPLPSVTVLPVEHDGNSGPVLVETPGFSLPSNLEFTPYIKSVGDAHALLLHSSSHPRLDYTAVEEKDGSAESLMKNYIGVFDAETSELQLIEVRKLTARVSLRSVAEEMREEREQAVKTTETLIARRHALGMEFGSKKSKKAIATQYENVIHSATIESAPGAASEDPVAAALMENITKATGSMPSKQDLQNAIDDAKPRPKANLDAETVRDVYPVDVVVSKDFMTSIHVKDWVDAVEAGKRVEVHSRFVASRIHRFATANDIRRLKVLRFILMLVNFNAALVKKGLKPQVLPKRDRLQQRLGESSAMVDAVTKRFASEAKDMSRWHVNNLLAHVCAAALIVDDYEVDVNDLRDDLRIENRDIRQLFVELGCRLAQPTEAERGRLKITKAESVNHTMARLRLPLSFPVARAARSAKGERR